MPANKSVVDMPSQANVRATRSRSLAESEHVQAKRRRDGQDCKVTCRNKVLRNDETEQMNRKNGEKNSQLQDKERSDSTGIIWKRTTMFSREKGTIDCSVRRNECGSGGRGRENLNMESRMHCFVQSMLLVFLA